MEEKAPARAISHGCFNAEVRKRTRSNYFCEDLPSMSKANCLRSALAPIPDALGTRFSLSAALEATLTHFGQYLHSTYYVLRTLGVPPRLWVASPSLVSISTSTVSDSLTLSTSLFPRQATMAEPNQSSSALVRKRAAEMALMPPPPPAKKIKRPKKVIDEEAYTDALSKIIARDFFPGLLQSETQQEYLDALESKDKSWISNASRRLKQVMTPGRQHRLKRPVQVSTPLLGGQTPVGYEGDTPVTTISAAPPVVEEAPEVDTNMSLGAFQSKYTSEDNESFYKLLDKQNQKRAKKYGWLWRGNKLPSNQELAQMEVKARLIASGRTLKDDGFERDRLAIEDKNGRPAMPDTWKFNPRNALMFAPDGVDDDVPQTLASRAQEASRAGPKTIVYDNTRMPGLAIAPEPSRPLSPTLSAVRDAIAGRPREGDRDSTFAGGNETPRVNGYAFVDDEEPQGFAANVPTIDLGPGDATPNPFKFQDQRKREGLHHRMVDRIALSKRTSAKMGLVGKVEKTPVPKFPNSPRVSGGLTPAAQRLWSRIGGTGRDSDKTPFTGTVTPKNRGSGLKNVTK